MQNKLLSKSPRIEAVDALRGFAVMAIILLHNIEHFNLYDFPKAPSPLIEMLDGSIWNTLFFLFGGKAYAIFSLLFGFSFYIQLNNQVKKGGDFRGRFLWRLFLLLCLGFFNAVFFPGDILVLYAIVGVVLIPVRKWSDTAVLVLGIILLLQPMEWGKFFYALLHPDYVAAVPTSYGKYMYPALRGDSFIELVKSNFWYGQLFSLSWAWHNGRFFQTAALFMFGMWLGRKQYFVSSNTSVRFWLRALPAAIICFIPLYLLKDPVSHLYERVELAKPLSLIISSLANFAFMSILVSLFMLLWQSKGINRVLHGLVPYGRMSLTNYISQSVVGSFIYFGYGLGMYRHLGTTYSFLVGVLLFVIQLYFCRWWLSRHKQGPFEGIWRKATWVGKKA